MINLSEKIFALRKAHNLTQEALGEAVGVSAQAVSKWEKGDSLPDISIIADVCRVFGISADALLGNEGSMTSKMYVEKALEVCNGNQDEKMRLLYQIMDDGVNKSGETARLCTALWDAHVFSLMDSRGFGMFFSDMEYIKDMMCVDFSTTKLIKFISDDKALKIFIQICINGQLNDKEIIEITGFSEQEVAERLFVFMKSSVIQPVTDEADGGNGMAYAVAEDGILLMGIMVCAFLSNPKSKKGISGTNSHMNRNPKKLRKFME